MPTKKIKQRSLLDYFLIAIPALTLLFVGFIDVDITRNQGVFMLASVTGILFTFTILTKRMARFPITISIMFLGLMLWMFIAGPYSKDLTAGPESLLMASSIFTLFIAVYNLASNNNQLQTFSMRLLTIVSTLIIIKVLMTVVLGKGTLQTIEALNDAELIPHIIIAITGNVTWFLQTKNPWLKTAYFLLTTLSLLIAGILLSPLLWVSAIIALIIVLGLHYAKVRSERILLTSIITIVILCAIVILAKVQTKTVLQSNLPSYPQSALITTMEMIKKNPVFGVGPGVFPSAYHTYQQEPWTYYPQNVPVIAQRFAELGIVGAFLITLIIFYIAKALLKLHKKDSVPTIIIASLAGFLILTFTSSQSATLSAIIIMVIASALSVAQVNKKEVVMVMYKRNIWIYLIPLLLLTSASILIASNNTYEKSLTELINGNTENARKEADRAILLNPLSSQNYTLRGAIFEQEKRIPEAQAMYQKALEIAPVKGAILYHQAELEAVNGNYPQAEKYLRDTVATMPYATPRYYMTLAEILSRQNKKQEAADVLKKALKDNFPVDKRMDDYIKKSGYTVLSYELADAYITYASLELDLGNKPEAQAALEVVEKKLYPDHPGLKNLKKKLE